MRDVGVIEFGLSLREFWELTWADYDALFQKLAERERRMDRRFAMIAAYVANFAGRALPDGQSKSISDILGYPEHANETEFERFRRQYTDPVGDYMRKLQASEPNTEFTMSQAVLDAAARGLGTWSKVERPMQSVAIAKAMNPNWKPS
jgi:hypothetical protein